jgi:hypothetical protein
VRTEPHPAHFQNTIPSHQTAVDHENVLGSAQSTKEVDPRYRAYYNVFLFDANRLKAASDHRDDFRE